MGILNPSQTQLFEDRTSVPIPAQPSWYGSRKTVSFDPWGHLVPQVSKKEIDELGLDIRPRIAVTKVHIKQSELDESARKGELKH